jgi:hypothetical protein
MVRISLLFLCLGLAVNMLLWSVPGMVAATYATRVIPPADMPALATLLKELQLNAGAQVLDSIQTYVRDVVELLDRALTEVIVRAG